MENEKKTETAAGESSQNKKHRPNRRRGYFIEPNAPSSGNAPKQASSANGEVKKQGGTAAASNHPNQTNNNNNANNGTGGNGNGGNKKRRRRNRSKNHANPADSAERNPATSASAPLKKEDIKSGKASEERKNGDGGKGRHGRRRPQDRQATASNKPEATATTENEYEEVRFPAEEPSAPSTPAVKSPEKPVPKVEVVGIRFKSSGKVYYFSPGGKRLRRGEHAIVETARGQEYGEVTMGNNMVKQTDIVPPLRSILRVATAADQEHHKENKQKEEEAFRMCNEKIREHGLDMKLIDAQYTFDNSKLLFYFTSAGRVDFRDLVKDLAAVFRTRIELRQIGIRDEAKLMGGMGMCGRSLCCTLFLSDFGQVSIKMAKEQNLSLNSAKISGICGRLMCCLRYEHETYEYEIKRTPPVDSLVRTADGDGVVTEIHPLAGTVKVRLQASPDTAPKLYHRDDVVMLRKKSANPHSK
ncbi:MAG: hypothetical protein E7668_04710 [Ruminococcaceae bacterium]|nr:hypothetical protein [Oscillospiraceae bacterium]